LKDPLHQIPKLLRPYIFKDFAGPGKMGEKFQGLSRWCGYPGK